MKLLSVRCAAFLAALFACLAASAPSFAQAVPLITQPVDESQRVVLRGNTRTEVRPEFDRGRVADSLPLNGIELLLKRSSAQEQAAEALADDLQRAGSPQFHKWLTADQYAAQFGAAPQDIATISAWLSSHGFTVDDPSPSMMTITFSGTAGQVREAFGTEIHNLVVKGVQHIANASDPSIPAALAPAIEGVVSLHDFRPHKQIVPKAQYTFSNPFNAGAPFFALGPADLATVYNFNPLFAAGITGKGQTIALISDSDVYSPNDWTTFRNAFGLDAYKGSSLTTVHPGRGCADPGLNPNGDDIESAVDVDWASAAAPSAALQLVTCADTTTTFGGLIAIQNLVNQRLVPPIISMSYADCEVQNGATRNAAFKAAYLQAVLEGVSVFVVAGDNGPAMCDYYTGGPVQSGVAVNALASTGYNVAVGGTDFGDYYAGTTASYWSPTNFADYRSVLSYVPEIPWNDTCAGTLLSSFLGFATPYGVDGLCASPRGVNFLYNYGGGGGPSNCATGESTLGSLAVYPSSYAGPTPSNGTCRGWEKPSWQNVLGNPNDGVRDLPDVVMFAADGLWDHSYMYCNSDPATGGPCVLPPSNWSLSGGTSFASPIMAGIQALVNQVWGSYQGNPAPIYYTLANLEYGRNGNKNCASFANGGPARSCIFNDITVGDNDMDCVAPYNCYAPGAPGAVGVLSLSDKSYEPAFKAGVGWDFATGLGSVNATNLVLNPIWLIGSILGSL